MPDTKEHYLPYAFPFVPTIRGELDGGLPASVLRDMVLRLELGNQSSLRIISPDETSLTVPKLSVEVIAAEPETIPNADRFGYWFGDMWVVMHPNAHLSPTYPQDILETMFPGEKYKAPVGSLERAIEHVHTHGFLAKNPDVASNFARRFERAIENIPPGSIINYQDYMFGEVINLYGDKLRNRDCFQTLHVHTSIPEQLDQFEQGRRLLLAMSKMDTVFVHTDEYASRIENQLLRLGLPIPEIRRFDLGIDTKSIERRLQEVHPNNFMETSEFKAMPSEQQAVIQEIVSTQERDDIHRFLVIDRADQGKGQSIVLDAMDRYLSSLPQEEQSQHRFYFILPQLDWEVIDNHPQRLYIDYLRNKLEGLKRKYPNVLYYTHGIPPKLIPLVSRNAHAITGGVQDGLCLSPQEVLKITELLGKNRTGIIGKGVGFAMQTIRTNPDNQAFVNFVQPGSVDDIVEAFVRIVTTEKTNPQQLGENTRQLVRGVIDIRRSGIIFPIFP